MRKIFKKINKINLMDKTSNKIKIKIKINKNMNINSNKM
jgi:hypothetical protein